MSEIVEKYEEYARLQKQRQKKILKKSLLTSARSFNLSLLRLLVDNLWASPAEVTKVNLQICN